MLVAAIQSMAWGMAGRAHTACTGRSISENSISGSLPTEIRLLSRLQKLYSPSLCSGLLVHFCGSAREQIPCFSGGYAEHGMREGN